MSVAQQIEAAILMAATTLPLVDGETAEAALTAEVEKGFRNGVRKLRAFVQSTDLKFDDRLFNMIGKGVAAADSEYKTPTPEADTSPAGADSPEGGASA